MAYDSIGTVKNIINTLAYNGKGIPEVIKRQIVLNYIKIIGDKQFGKNNIDAQVEAFRNSVLSNFPSISRIQLEEKIKEYF